MTRDCTVETGSNCFTSLCALSTAGSQGTTFVSSLEAAAQGPSGPGTARALIIFYKFVNLTSVCPRGICLPAFLYSSLCLFVCELVRSGCYHQLHTSLALSRMWPSLEAIWLTPVSEVTKWYPLYFLPSLLFFLHLSFLYVWAAAVTQGSFSLASLHQRLSLPHGS